MTERSVGYSSNLSIQPDRTEFSLGDEEIEGQSGVTQTQELELKDAIKTLRTMFPGASEDLIISSLMRNSKLKEGDF